MLRNKRVAILYGAVGVDAPADEQDALVEVEAVGCALARLGLAPEPVPLTLDLEAARARLARLRPRFVFNLVESVAGRGRLIHLGPALLEDLQMPYTGAGLNATFLSSNKVLAKDWLAVHEVPTPPRRLPGCTLADSASTVWIVKSVWEHASIGIDDHALADDMTVDATLEARRQALGGDWFAEQYIEGREFNLSLLAGDENITVLPIAEMTFVDYPPDKPRIVTYAAKWHVDAFEYHHTQRRFFTADASLGAQLDALARRCWALFDLRGYARVDVRVDGHGHPWVLEVNTNPCLASDAGFSAALQAAGIAFDTAIARIVSDALRPPAQP